MLPLNRPGNPSKKFKKQPLLSNGLKGLEKRFFFTANDGLNYVYQLLYEKHGSLRVAVSPLACFQALYPIVLNGHTPVLVDVDKFSFILDVSHVDQWPEVDAVEIVYMGGGAVDLAPIVERKWIVIEDCAQAMGGKWQDKWLGTIGDYGVYSILKNVYFPAGLVVSRRNQLDAMNFQSVPQWVYYYKWIKSFLESHASYQPSIINSLYGMLLRFRAHGEDCKNSVRCVQGAKSIENKLLYLESMNDKRRSNALYIQQNVNNENIVWQQCPKESFSTYNRLLFVSKNRLAKEIIIHLRKRGIAANNLTQSYIHPWQEPVWQDELLKSYYFAESLPIYNCIIDRVVAVPNSPFLTEREIDYMVQELNGL